MKSALNEHVQQQLQKLQILFHEQLPGKLRDIEQAFADYKLTPSNQESLDLLYRLVHNLVGSAGSFGAQQITQEALHLDAILKPLYDRQEIASQEILDSLSTHLTTTIKTARQWDPLANTQQSGLEPDGVTGHQENKNLIYLVEDDTVQAQQLIELLGGQYQVQHFTDTASFKRAYEDQVPCIIIMDMIFDEAKFAGADVLLSIKEKHFHLPPVIFISVRNDMAARLAAQRAGATRYFHKPVDPGKLQACVNGLTHHAVSEPYRVLIIDDDQTLGQYYCEVMEAAGMNAQYCGYPLQALDLIEQFKPELILLDIFMPDVTGLELAAVIRQDDTLAQIPIVFLSTETDMDKQLAALQLGGDDFLSKPVAADHLVASITARVKRHRWTNRLNSDLKLALQEIESRQIALDHHSIVSTTDTNGNITDINRKFIEISGYSRAELIGQNHRMISSGQHPTAFFESMWATISRGYVWHGEICNRAKDGHLYWVESTIVPFLDQNGLPYKYVSIRTDITDLMQTQQALHDSDKIFRAIFNNIQDVFYQADNEGRITMMSPSIEKYTGYTPDELLGQPLTNFYEDPADRDRLLRELEANDGSVTNFETILLDKSGNRVEMSTNSHFVRDEQGKVIGVEGTVRDITQTNKTKRALQESEMRLKRSQEFANIGTWDWDIQTGEIFWSERIGPLFGYHESLPDTTYENFLNAVHPDDRDNVIAAVNACVQGSKDYNIEHRVIWQDGSIHWMLEQGDVIRAEDGKPLHMLGVVQDITHRKQAELSLIERERQLREAQAMAHLGSWQADMVTGQLNWSDEIYRIFGYEVGSFSPSVEAFKAAVHPDDQQKVYESEQLASQTGRHDVIHRIVRPDGSIRHVHELANAELDSNGNMIRLVGTVQDITEQVKAEQALIAARDEAEEANRAKSLFLSSMSHELRTPMNAILGFGQLLEMDVLNSDQLDYIQEILKAGKHLLELINEILDLSKIESGRLDLSIEAVSFNSVLNECQSLLNPLFQKHGISLSIDQMTCQQVYVMADAVRLKQVMINLLSNAIKYNRPEGTVTIQCETRPQHNTVTIKVIDTGRGIRQEAIADIYTPFSRIDNQNSNIEGTGIGLAITRNLVELMNGEIGVESQLGEGSTFWFTLPLADPAQAHVQHMIDRDEEISSENALTHREYKFSILYIEDNPTNQRLVQQMLSRWLNVDLLSAYEPFIGLELIQANKPDLILLDINLPGIDGFEVLERIQSDPLIANIPVIAVSANAMPRDIERGIQAGFREYVTKPIQVAEFLTAIAKVLELPADKTPSL